MFRKAPMMYKEWMDIVQRVAILEDQYLKKPKRLRATKAQKILILKHMGLLEKIDEIAMSQNKKALLLSVLLDADRDNVETDLSHVHLKESPLRNEPNYAFLVEFFEKINEKQISGQTFDKQIKECDGIYREIRSIKESSK
jgi:hypothetical protein